MRKPTDTPGAGPERSSQGTRIGSGPWAPLAPDPATERPCNRFGHTPPHKPHTPHSDTPRITFLESAVVALSATIGQAIIPVPVLGAVIGGTTGSILSQVVEDGLNARERELAARLFEENRTLDAQLESEWRQHLDRLKADMEVFLSLVVEMASVDAAAACEASVALARRLGIPSEDILDTPEKARAYFMD